MAANPSPIASQPQDPQLSVTYASVPDPAELCIRTEEQSMINDLVRLYFSTVHCKLSPLRP